MSPTPSSHPTTPLGRPSTPLRREEDTHMLFFLSYTLDKSLLKRGSFSARTPTLMIPFTNPEKVIPRNF